MPQPRSRFKRLVLFPLVRGLTGFPLALAAVLGAPFGLSRFPAVAQRRVAQRFGRVPHRTDAGRAGYGRSLLFSLATLIPSVVVFVAAVVCVFVAFSGYLYPVRPDVIEFSSAFFTPHSGLKNAWGGPTLAGAWLAHALVAVGFQVVGLALCLGYSRLQDALVRRLL